MEETKIVEQVASDLFLCDIGVWKPPFFFDIIVIQMLESVLDNDIDSTVDK